MAAAAGVVAGMRCSGVRFGAVVAVVTVVVVGLAAGVRAQMCPSGELLQTYVVSDWGTASTPVANCNAVYLTTIRDQSQVDGVNPTWPPSGWQDPSYNDAAWGAGVAPFADASSINNFCQTEFQSAIPGGPSNIGVSKTNWEEDPVGGGSPVQSFIAVRFKFYLAPSLFFRVENFKVSFIVETEVLQLYVNGESQSFTFPGRGGSCSDRVAPIEFTLSSSDLVPEDNVLAILAEQRRQGSTRTSYLNFQTAVEVCALSTPSDFACMITNPAAQACMVPCTMGSAGYTGAGNQCELSTCNLDGLVADPVGNCNCEVASQTVCPAVSPMTVANTCYLKETRDVVRLNSCSAISGGAGETCRAPA
ncbi:hypothetical protein FVE85_8439 [Porphyridium purpureum]|uniref:Uncharacterized protein n=1 Tax=Porphyridium purpureum TaxID=35688 RepID=A0A5J4YNH8_PORPP|nr:hypothetical protein FVE85_8439 [Porphyridium purpureum]|eukprot:POR7310..scf244_11